MSDRAEAAGYRIKFQTINELAMTPPKAWPKRTDTVRALAVALDVTPRTIVLAYAESLGVDVGRPAEFANMLPAGTDSIDPEMRDALLGVIRVAARRSNAQTPEPRKEARGAQQQEPPAIGDPTQFAGMSGTAPVPPPLRSDLDLAAYGGDASQTDMQRERDRQDDIRPDPEGPEWGA